MRRPPAAAVALAYALVLAGNLLLWAGIGPGAPPTPPAQDGWVPPAAPSAVAASSVVASSVVASSVTPSSVLASSVTAAPVPAPIELEIARIGVRAPVGAVGHNAAGAIAVPPPTGDGTSRVWWYRELSAPGAPGPAVIVGHVDSARDGPAVFYRLGELRPGDLVTVRRSDGVAVRFAVQGVGRYPKSAFPTAAVYGPTTGPTLRLITCGGSFDRSRGSYRDNIVVFATATP